MISIEDGNLIERHPFFSRLENLLANQRGLFVNVIGGDDQRQHTIRPAGDHFLGEAGRVVSDGCPGERDDLGGRPVIDV